MKKKLKLGLFGFGCVGQGLYHVLHEIQGVKAEIKKVCVKNRNKVRPVPDSFFTFDKSDILDDPDIDIVVELIDDATAAFEILKEALPKGKAVVTANKKMLAEHLEEIYELQKKSGKPFCMKDQSAEAFRSSGTSKSIMTTTSFKVSREFSTAPRTTS